MSETLLKNKKIQVLIVDDSAVVRKLIASVVIKQSDMEVMGAVANGLLGVEFIRQTPPDVVLLDIEMPVMDGIEALKTIRKFDAHIPIIIFSSLTQKGASITIQALTSGASDYLPKPANMGDLDQAMTSVEELLIPKIRNLHARKSGSLAANRPQVSVASIPIDTSALDQIKVKALCIGVSTGGPAALMQIFGEWKKPLSVPVFIVQHMPPKFTEFLASRLTEIGCMSVEEPYDGQIAKPGMVYLAPGGMHMALIREDAQVVIHLNDGPLENSCRPSVDVLFRTAAQVYGSGLLAVILTGMGSDGLKGAYEVSKNRGSIIAQDESSSVVWGMPGAVVRANLAQAVMPLNAISHEVEKLTC
jgi:two-component system, chemotaxis family, protein-glutamate methylesterase/glutaminase